jgi:Protein of unknown function (DUF3466)
VYKIDDLNYVLFSDKLDLVSPAVSAAPSATFGPVSPPPPPPTPDPMDINNAGVIVGRYNVTTDENGNPLKDSKNKPITAQRAFVYDPQGDFGNKMLDLGTRLMVLHGKPGSGDVADDSILDQSVANKVNSFGIVVGRFTTYLDPDPANPKFPDDLAHAFLYDPNLANGTYLDLQHDYLAKAGFMESQAFSINDLGDVIGTGRLLSDSTADIYYMRSWLLNYDRTTGTVTNPTPTLIKLPDEDEKHGTAVRDINNFQVIAGCSPAPKKGHKGVKLPPTNDHAAFRYDPPAHLALAGSSPFTYVASASPTDPTDSRANAINDAGSVVGGYGSTAFLYENGARTTLPDTVEAFDINSIGDIVGNAADDKGTKYPFLSMHPDPQDQPRDAPDLNGWLPPQLGWRLQSARAINDYGQIVGLGTHHGKASGFLLTPTTIPLPPIHYSPRQPIDPTVKILFGVSQDGSGTIVLPDGTFQRIPAWGSPDVMYRAFTRAMADMLSGLAVRQIASRAGSSHARREIERSGLDLIEQATRQLLHSIDLWKGGTPKKE